jgi:cation diffusion facilitator family transporter
MSDLTDSAGAASGAPSGLKLRKLAVAAGSLATTIVLTFVKLLIGILSGSLALIADALQGLADIIITALTLIVVAVSDRGADPRWTAGRQKTEAMAALAEAALLTVFGICIWYLGLQKMIFGTAEVHVEPWYLVAVAGAVLADWWRGLVIRRAARDTGSLALEANAAHFLTDALASAAVLAGLVCAALGFGAADTLATLVVAALLLLTAWRVGLRGANILLERGDPDLAERALAALEADRGVIAVTTLRIGPLPSGHRVDVAVRAAPADLAALADLQDRLARRLGREIANADILVAVVPEMPVKRANHPPEAPPARPGRQG